MKKCSRCGTERSVEEFGRKKQNRDGLASWCRPCDREYHNARYARESETVDAKRNLRAENKHLMANGQRRCRSCDLVKAVCDFPTRSDTGRYRNECKSCLSVANGAWRAENVEQQREYRRANSERRVASSSEWKRKNPDRVKGHYSNKQNKRRALLAGGEVEKLPANYREILFDYYGNVCLNPNCTKTIDEVNYLTADHILPIRMGGAHSFSNMQPLCRSCNSRKNGWSTDDYRQGNIIDKEVVLHV